MLAIPQVLVGDYDASTFVLGNFATYPQLPPGAPLYTPSMRWNVTVAGTVHGQVCSVADQLFATGGGGRTYGELTFGGELYGRHREFAWTVAEVFFFRWDSTRPPPDTDPYPNAGCPFTPPHGVNGEWAPGWNIVVEVFYNALGTARSRVYGELAYGAEVFGGSTTNRYAGRRWVDITHPSFHVELGDGTVDGLQVTPVAEAVVTTIDEAGEWFDFAVPETWFQPQPGDPLRVGLIDPNYNYHPLFTGELERIEDRHDGEHPRVVSLRGFGMRIELTVDKPQVQRPREMASARFRDLAVMAGPSWNDGSVVYPADDAMLLADVEPHDIVIVDELDRTVTSVGWTMDTTARGRLRVRQWPLAAQGAPIVAIDCYGQDRTQLTAHVMNLANDQSRLLNSVVSSNTAAPTALSIEERDPISVSRFGPRGRTYGYPKTGLAWELAATATAWARRILDRFALIVRHIESIEVDTLVDQGWLPVLVDLDTGRPVTTMRTGVRPLTFDTIVVGWHHVLEPGRWTSTINLVTTNPSLVRSP